MDEERTKILQMVEAGTISAEQGLALLNALDEGQVASEGTPPPPSTPPPDLATQWRHVWLYIVYAGVGILVGGAICLAFVYTGGSAWWGVCGWPLLLLGALVATLGAWSRTARWLHVRVTGKDHRIAISMPLPLKLAAWGVKIAQRFAPEKFAATGVDEVIASLGDSLDKGGQPFYVDVTNTDDGEHVQVYIG